MDKRWLTIILGGSLVGGQVVGEIGKHVYRQPETHVEIHTDAGADRRGTIAMDSSVATTATMDSLALMKILGLPAGDLYSDI
jgi:hypothetical protein